MLTCNAAKNTIRQELQTVAFQHPNVHSNFHARKINDLAKVSANERNFRLTL